METVEGLVEIAGILCTMAAICGGKGWNVCCPYVTGPSDEV